MGGVSEMNTTHCKLMILLALLCALTSGCRRDQDAGKIRIKYWTFPLWTGITGNEKDGTTEDWPRLKIKEFEKTHPNIKIDLEVVTWQGGMQKLDLSALSGTYPDICYLATANLPKYASQGILEPIDGEMTPEEIADIYPNVLDCCKYQGKTYVWPWLCNALCLAINVDLFKERHIERLIPKPPERAWTYDQFTEACKSLTFDRDDGHGKVYGYALYGIPLSVEYQMLTLVLGFGGEVYNKQCTQFTLNSPESVKGFQFLMDLLDKYKVVPPGPAGMQGGQVGQMFANQEVAIQSSTSGILKSLKMSAAKGDFPFFNAAIVQPPHLPGRKPASMLSVGGYAIFKQTDARKRQAAIEFARFLTNEENCRALTVIGQFPARKSVGNIYPGDVDMGVVARLIPMSRVYFTAGAAELNPVINNIYQSIFTHAMTPAEALADAQKKANKILAQDALEKGLDAKGGTK